MSFHDPWGDPLSYDAEPLPDREPWFWKSVGRIAGIIVGCATLFLGFVLTFCL